MRAAACQGSRSLDEAAVFGPAGHLPGPGVLLLRSSAKATSLPVSAEQPQSHALGLCLPVPGAMCGIVEPWCRSNRCRAILTAPAAMLTPDQWSRSKARASLLRRRAFLCHDGSGRFAVARAERRCPDGGRRPKPPSTPERHANNTRQSEAKLATHRTSVPRVSILTTPALFFLPPLVNLVRVSFRTEAYQFACTTRRAKTY